MSSTKTPSSIETWTRPAGVHFGPGVCSRSAPYTYAVISTAISDTMTIANNMPSTNRCIG